MRKIYSFMVAAVATFAAISCTQELDNNVPEQTGETVVYTASTDVDTKAVLDGVVSKWCGEELITLHDGTNAFNFYANAGETPTTTVDFEYTPGEGQPAFTATEVLAVYPSGNYTANIADKTVSNINIPNNQTLADHTYPATAAIAVAYSTDMSTLNFKNATTLLKFKVAGDDVTYGCFAAEGHISGNFDAAYNDGKPALTPTDANNWVDFHKNGDFLSKEAYYYVAVAPAELNKLTVYLNGTEVKSKTFEKPYQLKRNVILDLGTFEYTAPETASTIYLKPGEWAAADSPQFFAYFYNSNGDTSVKMSVNNSNGLYEVAVPEGYSKVIFCRVNTTAESFDWEVVWNQTENLDVPVATTDKLCYVITGWGEGDDAKSTGEWQTIEDATYVAPEWTIAGTFNDWNTTSTVLVQSGDYVVVKGLELNGAEFKVLHNGEWLGYGAVALDTWTAFGGASNISVTNAVADKTYDIYVNPNNNKFVVVENGVSTPAESADVWGICGTFTNGWDINSNIHMTARSNGWYTYEGVEIYKDDQFKFVTNDSWTNSLGAKDAVLTAESNNEYDLVVNGLNIQVSKNGIYTINLNPSTKKFKVTCTEEYTSTVDITINNKANWSPLYITLWDGETKVVNNATVTDDKYAVSGDYIGRTLTCQFSNGSKTSDKMNVSITKDGATVVLEETIIKLKVQLNTSNSKQYWGSTMKIHVWNTGTSFDTSWPGTTMTSEGNYTWSIVVPSELVGKTINYLVHNGNSWQSSDSKVTIKAEGNTVTGSSIGIN